MADPRIPEGTWIVAWVQSIDPEDSDRSWRCTTVAPNISCRIPRAPYPGFEWEEEDPIHYPSRYRVIAVLDERSSKLLSVLKELEDWTGDESYIFEEGINSIVAAVIEGLQKAGRPY